MTNQLNIFLLLFGSLQGFLLSWWLFRNKNRKLSTIYLTLFLLVVGLQLTFKVVTKVWLMSHVFLAYQLSYKFPYLIGPLLFLYVSARLDGKFRRQDLLHFLPFAGSMVMVMLMMMRLWPSGWFIHPYTDMALQITSLMVYGLMTIALGNAKLKRFIYLVVVTEIIISVTLAVMYMYYPRFPDVRLFFVALTILIYWISYKIIDEPDLLLEKDSASTPSLSFFRKNKYAHSSLKPEEASRIESAIQQFLVNDKLFLNASLTIDALALKIQTSRHHLSQVLNERLGKSYTEFLTDLRLAEAKARLVNPVNNRYTIAAIALDSGFSSVSGFNELFKKRFGVTPSQFRDQYLKKMSA